MLNKKTASLFVMALLAQTWSFAQTINVAATNANEGFMRSEGKIYVAMTVACTILAGLILFLLRLDKKIAKLEK